MAKDHGALTLGTFHIRKIIWADNQIDGVCTEQLETAPGDRSRPTFRTPLAMHALCRCFIVGFFPCEHGQ